MYIKLIFCRARHNFSCKIKKSRVLWFWSFQTRRAGRKLERILSFSCTKTLSNCPSRCGIAFVLKVTPHKSEVVPSFIVRSVQLLHLSLGKQKRNLFFFLLLCPFLIAHSQFLESLSFCALKNFMEFRPKVFATAGATDAVRRRDSQRRAR